MTKLLYSDRLERMRQREQHFREDVRLQAKVDTPILKLGPDAESPSYGRDLVVQFNTLQGKMGQTES